MDKRAAEILLNLTYSTVEEMERLLSFSHLNCEELMKAKILNIIGNQMMDLKVGIITPIYRQFPDLEKTFETSYKNFGRYC